MQILHNGQIITCDPHHPLAEAIAVDDDRIVAVGSNSDILNLVNPWTKSLDLNHQTIIPGLTDAHIHLEEYALSLTRINCDTPTKPECLQIVKEKVQKTSAGKWILGHGWDHNLWGTNLPLIQDLDEVAPQNPVYLTGKSMHIAWVNHRALELASIDENSLDPPGGRIERDSRGEPSGMLMDTAVLLVEEAIPLPAVEECIEPFKAAIQNLNQVGITSVHEFDEVHGYKVLQLLHSEKSLNLRVYKGIPWSFLDQAIAEGWQTGKGNDWIRIGPLKLFSDGALGSKTAWMLEPYEGFPQDKGLSLISREDLTQIGKKVLSAGIFLAVHAIGDQANRIVIDAFEKLREFESAHQLESATFRIEHLQLINPVDISRLAKARIVASMQPIHATSDAPMADRLWGKRVNSSYAWKSIMDAGVMLIFGSDCPVENPNPFWGIHAAVTRQFRDSSSHPWHPEQSIAFMPALQAYTTNPAIAAHVSDHLGMLKAGYVADLACLSENPMMVPPNALYNNRVTGVMLAGKWLFQKK
jgi:predicted amidohydrolase YtcJ